MLNKRTRKAKPPARKKARKGTQPGTLRGTVACTDVEPPASPPVAAAGGQPDNSDEPYLVTTYADGHAGAIYGQYPPLVNASRGPSEWQTFDIFFVAPRFEGQRLVSPAYATVVHNGVLIHLHREIQGPTGHKIVASYDEPHGPTGPVVLQDHGDLVRYRNIWVRPIEPQGDA